MYQLTKNMRLKQTRNRQKFSDLLLSIGEGKMPVTGESLIEIPGNLKFKPKDSRDYTTINFCNEIFKDINRHVNNILKFPNDKKGIESKNWLTSRAIICPTNPDAQEINEIMMKKLKGEAVNYKSFDRIINTQQAHNYPPEFLNSRQHSSMPPHNLQLKVGAPIMLLRNLDPKVLSLMT